MDALIDEFAAAGEFGIGAPFAVVTHPSAMAVAGTEKHELAHDSGVKNFAGFNERRMKAVVESGAHDHTVFFGGGDKSIDFPDGCASGFFDDHMFAGVNGGEGDRCEVAIDGGDNDSFDVRIGNSLI